MADITDKIYCIIEEFAAMEIVSETESLFELGLDSLDKIELIMKIEDEFDIEISEELAFHMNTVSDSITFTRQLLNDKH